MSKFATALAVAAIALTAAPLAAFAAPAAAPVRLDISSVDFSNAEQVAAFKARVGEAQTQMCKSVADKKACREAILFKVNAQLSDSQKAAMAGSPASQMASTPASTSAR